MLRLTLLLCCTLFAVLLIGGRDTGQMRPGLAAAAKLEPHPRPVVTPVETASLEAARTLTVAAEAQPVTTPAPVALPATRYRGDRVQVLPLPPRAAEARAPQPVLAAATVAETRQPAGEVRHVTADAVNVRSGPSTAYPVVGRVLRGDAVLVDGPQEGSWAPIRIEGDGVSGYMAARFLAPGTAF
ncbi:SH3 domain-containing protein [Cereibacter sphaeroides]|uniref:SH3 domain-containing protein n=1 Tax=Cereibacter sphaeroides TaxID=1063 RepID=UPI000F535C6C|nr:SH3 domain-containing protein [Cereibacter sphaeroides]AZB65281.1 SH3 domain-containing protein [Cereibacter sphaeroides]AZB67147.1 SH3 domain-containing protein [Cereibacter sphaeroides]